MNKHLTIEHLMHMQISEIVRFSQQEIQEFIYEADESIRKAKLLRKWLDGALKAQSDQQPIIQGESNV